MTSFRCDRPKVVARYRIDRRKRTATFKAPTYEVEKALNNELQFSIKLK